MKNLTATVCLTIALLIGSAGISLGAEANLNILKTIVFIGVK